MPLFIDDGKSPLEAADAAVSAHAVLDHTGITGVGDLTIAAHATLDHTGITGVGDLTIAAHASLDHAGITGVPETESTSTSPGTGSDATRTLPANTLNATGENISFEVWGRNTSGGSTDILTISLGATTIFTNTILSSFQEFIVRGTIIRTGSASQLAGVSIALGPAGGTQGAIFTRTVGSEDLTTALALTAADTSNNLAFDALIVRHWPS
tara:strand:+ start:59692 stop:60324 length:633 start_codon:yes stop_codon:yes gene_type:complete